MTFTAFVMIHKRGLAGFRISIVASLVKSPCLSSQRTSPMLEKVDVKVVAPVR